MLVSVSYCCCPVYDVHSLHSVLLIKREPSVPESSCTLSATGFRMDSNRTAAGRPFLAPGSSKTQWLEEVAPFSAGSRQCCARLASERRRCDGAGGRIRIRSSPISFAPSSFTLMKGGSSARPCTRGPHGSFLTARLRGTHGREKSGREGCRRRGKLAGIVFAGGLDLDLDFEPSFENGLAGRGFSLSLPPDPVQFPRKPLDLRFAVLLMRSSYEAVDELDFVPMDKFQVKFWKLRQSEVQPYKLQYEPLRIRYGDLSDPLYFDFISCSQYLTISECLKSAESVFQERLGAEGSSQVVVRPASLSDNSLLPAEFKKAVGRRIFSGLVDGFQEERFGGPAALPDGAGNEEVLAGVKQILDIFVQRGYALAAYISKVNSNRNGELQFKVKVEGPANLWALQTLASRRALVFNDFHAMSIKAFLNASNKSTNYRLKFSSTGASEQWSVA